MKTRPVRQPEGGGFTLVEIMVVIGILTMVLALGAPSFVRIIKKEPLRQAASDLVEGLSHARAQAILQGVTTEFVLNATDRRMTVRLAPEPSPEATNPYPALASPDWPMPEVKTAAPADATMPPFSARLPEDVVVTLLDINFGNQLQTNTDEVRVRFHPNGTSDDFTIVIESRAGIRKVFLDAITGLADMEVLR